VLEGWMVFPRMSLSYFLGVPNLYKFTTFGLIFSAIILLVWNLFNQITSNRFFSGGFILLLNEVFLLATGIV
jgi:hypothetical protein